MSSDLREKAKRARVRKLVLALVSVALFLAIGVFAHFLPFDTLLPAFAIPVRQEGEMRIHFLSVGEGDCTLVEFPEGDVLVVDAGDGSRQADAAIQRYIKGLGSPALTLLATHADGDHIGGFPALIKTFGVKNIYAPAFGEDTPVYRKFLSTVEGADCPVETIGRYDRIERASGAYAVCISPRSEEDADENDASAVLYISYADVNILLAADISATRERLLLREYLIDSTIFDSGPCRVRLEDVNILKVPHHGSAYSAYADFLGLVGAETAIVSAGAGNYYRHPSIEAVTALKTANAACEVYRTDELGHIMITISDGEYSVRTEKDL